MCELLILQTFCDTQLGALSAATKGGTSHMLSIYHNATDFLIVISKYLDDFYQTFVCVVLVFAPFLFSSSQGDLMCDITWYCKKKKQCHHKLTKTLSDIHHIREHPQHPWNHWWALQNRMQFFTYYNIKSNNTNDTLSDIINFALVQGTRREWQH